MGRKPNTEVRRSQIIDALRQELASVGYERASTKSIAERAGLAAGLVHYHFKSKLEILLALIDGLIDAAESRHSSLLVAAKTPQEKLAAYVSARVGLGPTSNLDEVKIWVCIIAEAMGQAVVRDRVARWLHEDQVGLTGLFKTLKVERPAEQAATMLSMILGSFSLHSIGVEQVPSGYAERQMHRWLEMTLPQTATAGRSQSST